MSKRAEYKITFYKVKKTFGGLEYIFDTDNAIGRYGCLLFINSLQEFEVTMLVEDINRTLQGQLYDPDFLTSSEVFQVFDVQFSNPNILVDGNPIINISDLKILLEEWLYFINPDILNFYNVQFGTREGNPNARTIATSNTWLSQYIEDHYTFSDANRLLSGIDFVLENNDLIGGKFPTQSDQMAIINSVSTKIYIDLEEYNNDNNSPPIYTLPTSDFKVIVEAWRDYLKKPLYNPV